MEGYKGKGGMMLSEVNESVGGCEMLLGLTTWTQKWYGRWWDKRQT